MPFIKDWNPLHSPAMQWAISHLGVAAVVAVSSNPACLNGLVPTSLQGIAQVVAGLAAGALAKTAYGTALNTPPPVAQ